MASKKKVKNSKGQTNLQKNSKEQVKQSDKKENYFDNTKTSILRRQAENGFLPVVAFIAACFLVFYPPYFKGLFLTPALYITHMLTAIILILVLVSLNREKKFNLLRTPMDWTALAFAFAYLISLIGAVHPGDAFFGFIKVLNYLAIYWIISCVVRNWTQMETMLRVLVASGAGVAAVGLLASQGYSSYPHAIYGGTIVSTLEYSNTTASFLAVMVILAICLWCREKNFLLQLTYITVSAFMTLVILASSSKGTWLVITLGVMILIACLPRGYRFKTIYGLLLFCSGHCTY